MEQRVKDAVVDRFRTRTGRRPGVDLARPDVRIAVHLSPAETIVSLDLSGEGLHRRGYRLEGGGAPLKENLAAAILLRAGWPAVAARGGPLLDPMCGSGTLLIEGALIAADIAPGLLREYYGFLGWEGFDPAVWKQLLAEAAERRKEGLTKPAPAVRLRRRCARARLGPRQRPQGGLGGAHPVRARRGLGRPRPLRRGASAAGLVVTNPPYGKRLGEVAELAGLYETLGERLKQSFAGWEAAVFTANPDLSAHLGLRARRVNVLFNGPLEAKLLVFDHRAGVRGRPAGGGRRAAGGRGPGAGGAGSRARQAAGRPAQPRRQAPRAPAP